MGFGDLIGGFFKSNKSVGKGQMKKCPSCGDKINLSMERCPKCGVRIKSMFRRKCPKCGTLIQLDAAKCTKCFYNFEVVEKRAKKTYYVCPRCRYKMNARYTRCPACTVKLM